MKVPGEVVAIMLAALVGIALIELNEDPTTTVWWAIPVSISLGAILCTIGRMFRN